MTKPEPLAPKRPRVVDVVMTADEFEQQRAAEQQQAAIKAKLESVDIAKLAASLDRLQQRRERAADREPPQVAPASTDAGMTVRVPIRLIGKRLPYTTKDGRQITLEVTSVTADEVVLKERR